MTFAIVLSGALLMAFSLVIYGLLQSKKRSPHWKELKQAWPEDQDTSRLSFSRMVAGKIAIYAYFDVNYKRAWDILNFEVDNPNVINIVMTKKEYMQLIGVIAQKLYRHNGNDTIAEWSNIKKTIISQLKTK